MQIPVKSLLVSLLLVACGTTEETRYRDTTKLELPPTLQVNKQPIEQGVSDDSVIPD